MFITWRKAYYFEIEWRGWQEQWNNLITAWIEDDWNLRSSDYEAGKLLWNYECWWRWWF